MKDYFFYQGCTEDDITIHNQWNCEKKSKVETEKDYKLLQHMSTDNITEMNELNSTGTSLVKYINKHTENYKIFNYIKGN